MGVTETSTPPPGLAATADAAAAPSPALRPPPGNPRFPLFDGIRGVAVLAIFVGHAAEVAHGLDDNVLGRLIEAVGTQAIPVFFAVSGFLLYRPFISARVRGMPPPSVRRYARRRWARISPYWILLTLLALYPGVPGVFTTDWWKYYGFLQAYSSTTFSGGIAPAWTLSIDLMFYFVLPVWALLLRRAPAPRLISWELGTLAAVAIGGLVVQVLAGTQQVGYFVGISLAGQSVWIVIGMAFAVLSAVLTPTQRGSRILTAIGDHSGLCWIGVGVTLAALALLVPSGGFLGLINSQVQSQPAGRTALKVFLQATCVALVVLPAVFGDHRRGLPRRALLWRPMVWLGVISYSFYLFHLTVLEFMAEGYAPENFSATGLNLESQTTFLRGVATVGGAFLVTLILGSLSYRFIELPFLRRKERQPHERRIPRISRSP